MKPPSAPPTSEASIATGATEDAAAPGNAPASPATGATVAQGTAIGRYIVVGFVGRGGMGEVYAAYDPELNRKIAIKLLRPRDGEGAVNVDRRTRLQREAQAIARLSHPNVVVVYDVGTFRDSVFIAMEFIEGDTLGTWMAARPRGYREVLEVFLAAGRGLAAAHEAGLVHRDFKPDNVMIAKDGQARVMDFGLARESTGGPDSAAAEPADPAAAPGTAPSIVEEVGLGRTSPDYLQAKLTVTGAFRGTPAYAAPEQILGKAGDARVDQFSFCVALYEALYRERPFAGDTLIALIENVLPGKVRPPRPEAKVPAWLRRIVVRGLSAAPDDRFPTMAALFEGLGRDPAIKRRWWFGAAAVSLLVAGAAVAAHRVSVSQRAICAGGPSRSSAVWGPDPRAVLRRAFETSGNSGATQVLAVVGDLFDRYVAQWSGMYTETCEATQVRGEQSAEILDLRMECLNERLSGLRSLIDVFTSANAGVVDNAVVAASALPSLDRCADVAMLRAVIKPPNDLRTRASVTAIREEVARVSALSTAGQCDRAVPLGHKVVREAATLGYLPLKAEALYALGSGYLCSDLADGGQVLQEAILAAEASRHDEIAIRASVKIEGSDIQMSKYWIEHAEAILSRFPGRQPVLDAWIATGKANVLYDGAQYEDALPEAQRALTLKTRILGPIHIDTAISQMQVANILHGLGRDLDAEPMNRGAIDVFIKVLGQDNSRVAVALSDLCEILTALGRFDEARRSIEQALSIWKRLDAGAFQIGFSVLHLGRLQFAEGRFREARETLQKALDRLGGFSGTISGARFIAEAEFALARAMWPLPEGRQQAVAHARAARDVLERAKFPPRKRAEIVAWLRDHETR